jgi:hypothetical protein
MAESKLEYEPARPALRRRRLRRAVAALMLLVGAVAIWRAGPPFARQVRYVYWQSQCMRFTRPADLVAYEEDLTRAAVLLKRPEYLGINGPSGVPPPAGFHPPPLVQLQSRWGPGCVAFLHARTTPSGRNRLVVARIELEGGQFYPSGTLTKRAIRIHGSVSVPATLVPGSELHGDVRSGLSLRLQEEDQIRLFWGQADPDHGDHFTIGYQLNGQTGTLDGWLKDDGQLDLRVRDGPAKQVATNAPH